MTEQSNLLQIHTAYSCLKLMNLATRMQSTIQMLNKIELVTKDDSVLRVQKFDGDYTIISIVGQLNDVLPFFHPLVTGKKVYIDCRPFVNQDAVIKSLYEYKFLAMRGKLDALWVNDVSEFYPSADYVVDAFATWVSNGLSIKLNLINTVSNYIRIAAAIFYKGIYDDDFNVSRDDFEYLMIKKIPSILAIPSNTLTDILEEYGDDLYLLYKVASPSKRNASTFNVHLSVGTPVKMKASASDFTSEIAILHLCELISKLVDRTIKIDYTVLQNALCAGSVVASNSYEIATISLEHPPTFVSMMAKAVSGGTAGKTTVGQALSSIQKRHNTTVLEKLLSRVN